LNGTFTKDFVDDGWIQVNSASINKHYKNIINAESIDSTVFVVPQLQAMPSDINPEDTIKDVTTKYPDILNPLIFILIDKDTIPEEYAQIQNKLQALNESMTVCVLSMDKDTQKTVTKDELLGLWYTGTNVLADTQYTKTELPKSNISDTTEINDDDSQKAA
jgi:hypothetical protein